MQKLPKQKKCRSCRESFTPFRPLQIACSHGCAISLATAKREKEERKTAQIARKECRAVKERIKSRGQWLKEAQQAVNQFVRLRDKDLGCVSCDKPATWNGQWHASHYKSVGSSPALRFNLLNIHKSCSVCNNWKSGNIGNYRPELIRRIGIENVEFLEGHHEPRKYTIPELKAIRDEYRLKLRERKSQNES